MSLGVLNNISAIYAQNNLSSTQSSLQKTLQQLSSGSRINSGADDAAGLAVADGLHANSTALAQSTRNASDAVGLLQTADGALSQVTSLLDRAITLATQSGNGTLSSSQTSSANQEYQNILSQINTIGSTTNFNGSAVFSNAAKSFFVSDGTAAGSKVYNQVVGALSSASVGQTQTGGVTTPTLTVTTTSTASVAAVSTIATTSASNTFGGILSVQVGTGAAVSLDFTPGSSLQFVADAINSTSSSFHTAGIGATISGNNLVLTGTASAAGAGGGNNITLSPSNTFAETATGGGTGAGADFTATAYAALDTTAHSQAILYRLTNAVSDVAFQRGAIGAGINQISSAQSVTSNEQTNLTAAENNIRATDYGQAASDLSKYQVLSQTGISALAQANSVQQEVLKLLQ